MLEKKWSFFLRLKLFKEFKVYTLNSNPVKVSMIQEFELGKDEQGEEFNETCYKQLVGCLMYIWCNSTQLHL